MISVRQIIYQWWSWAEEQEQELSKQAHHAVENLVDRTRENSHRRNYADRLDDALIQLSQDLVQRLTQKSDVEDADKKSFSDTKRSPL